MDATSPPLAIYTDHNYKQAAKWPPTEGPVSQIVSKCAILIQLDILISESSSLSMDSIDEGAYSPFSCC